MDREWPELYDELAALVLKRAQRVGQAPQPSDEAVIDAKLANLGRRMRGGRR